MDAARRHQIIAYIVILTMPLSGLTIDIYTPALPIIAHLFQASVKLTQLTIAFYLAGYGLSQLFWGPLSDQIGRHKTILIGLYTFIIATMVIPFAPNIDTILVMRLIQGIAIGAINTCSRAVLLDLFDQKKFAKYTNYTTIAYALSPIIAPVIGSYLTQYLGWHTCFYFLTIYSVIILALTHSFYFRTNKTTIPFKLANIKSNVGSWEDR